MDKNKQINRLLNFHDVLHSSRKCSWPGHLLFDNNDLLHYIGGCRLLFICWWC